MWSRRLDGMIDTHEPPLFKSVLLERGFWPVVVGEVFSIDVPSPHSGGVKSSRQNEHGVRTWGFNWTRTYVGPREGD